MEGLDPKNRRWHKLSVYPAHLGAGSSVTLSAYIFGGDIAEVLKKYHRIKGIKREIGGTTRLPNIAPLSETDGKNLEKTIKEEGVVSLRTAKKRWYFPKESRI